MHLGVVGAVSVSTLAGDLGVLPFVVYAKTLILILCPLNVNTRRWKIYRILCCLVLKRMLD